MPVLSIEQLKEMQQIKLLRPLDDLNGLLQIMVFLHKNGRANISDFIRDLRLNQQPVYRTLGRLKKLDLVTVERESKSKYYYPTEAGAALAEKINTIYETFREIQ